MGTRLGRGEGDQLLLEAIDAYRAALGVFSQNELPQSWAWTQRNLGEALGEVGIRVGGEEGMNYLNEAIAVFDKALSVYDAMSFPELHNQILAAKSEMMRSRSSMP